MTSLALNFLGGAPFQLLYDGVKIAIRATKKFRTHLENLEFTLECLLPWIIQQISANNVQLNIPNDLIRDLETKMEEGKELVDKLSRHGIWNIRIWGNCCNCIMPNYADQLAGLDRSLRRLLEILKLEQIRNVQENLLLARNHNDKQDALDQKVSELLKVHMELLKEQKEMCDMMREQHHSVHHAMQRILVDGMQNGRGEAAPAPAPAPAYALGIVFRMLFDVVIQVKAKNKMCKRLIREFKSTLDFIKPLIEEMAGCNKVLHLPEQEQEDFIMQMTKGVELIHKCSKVCKWANYKKYECTNKLLKLDASLQVLFHKLSLQIAKHGKEALVSINSTEAVVKKIEGSSVVQNQIQIVTRMGLDVLNTHGRKDAEGTDMNEKEVGVKQIEGNGMRQNVKEIEGLSEVPETSSPITGLDVQGTKDTNETLDSERRNIEAQTKQIEGTSRVVEAPVAKKYKPPLLDEFKTSTHKILVTSRSECPQFGCPYYLKSEKSLNDEGTMTDLKGKKLTRGLWSPEEDEMLSRYITTHGLGSWSEVPEKAGLQRSAKSCRLRWINYLRPGIRRPSSKHLRFPPEDPLYSCYGEIMKERSLLPVEIKDQCPPNVKNTLDDEASGSTQNSVNQVNDVDGQYGGSSRQLISTNRSGGIPDKQQGVKERVALRTRSEEWVYFSIPTHKSVNNKPNPRNYYVGVYLLPRTTSGVCTVKLDQIISRLIIMKFLVL